MSEVLYVFLGGVQQKTFLITFIIVKEKNYRWIFDPSNEFYFNEYCL